MVRIAILLALMPAMLACAAEGPLSGQPSTLDVDEQLAESTHTSESTTSRQSRLTFATADAPGENPDVEAVKATLTAAGLDSAFTGRSRDDVYYAQFASCGGVTEIRDAILERSVPDDHTGSLNFQFSAAWHAPIAWQIFSLTKNGTWEVLVSGTITAECEVVKE